jgi:hypothetical protein
MKKSKFIKLNLKFQISNFCANVKVLIINLRTAVRQLANTLTVREFGKSIVIPCLIQKKLHFLTYYSNGEIVKELKTMVLRQIHV